MSLPKIYKSTGPVGRYYFCETGKVVPGQCIKDKDGKLVINPEFIKTLTTGAPTANSKYLLVDKKNYIQEAIKKDSRTIDTLDLASVRNNKSDLPRQWKEKGLWLSPSACNELWKMSKGDTSKINSYIEKSWNANKNCNCMLYGPTRGFYMSTRTVSDERRSASDEGKI